MVLCSASESRVAKQQAKTATVLPGQFYGCRQQAVILTAAYSLEQRPPAGCSPQTAKTETTKSETAVTDTVKTKTVKPEAAKPETA